MWQYSWTQLSKASSRGTIMETQIVVVLWQLDYKIISSTNFFKLQLHFHYFNLAQNLVSKFWSISTQSV